jgi:uncharacterized protein YjdB
LTQGFALTASANVTLQVITPYGAGQAGASWFPMQNAFEGQPSLDGSGHPVGGTSTSDAPYYVNGYGYIDFGPNWANTRITSTWTRYRAYTSGNQTPYAELWWDDDIDAVNDSGLGENRINFNSGQNLASTGTTEPWIKDSDAGSNPIVPLGRYLLTHAPAIMTRQAKEYAIVGWIHVPVTGIAITGAGGATTINTQGGTLQLTSNATPTNASDDTVAWSVINGTGSATISSGGLLTAVSNGTVTAMATAQDGSAVTGSLTVTINGQSGLGNEDLKVIHPISAGQAGSAWFPMQNAFETPAPVLDELTGAPAGGAGANDAPYYANNYGYIDFGADWNKVNITSTWTRYKQYTSGNQTPYAQIWWDDDTDAVNDSGLNETRINFNSAQNLASTGTTEPWIRDNDVIGSPVTPSARYMILRAPATMTSRAKEYAIIGWIDENGNGVQNGSYKPVTGITVAGAGGASFVLTGNTLQMSAAVAPYVATNKSVTWSVVNGTGSATIHASGLLTALSDGLVTVRATAQDGSGVVGSLVVNISSYTQFILPVQGASLIYYADIQASFPQVDWQTIDRLYIPAGHYQQLQLGNLPQRSAGDPLVITNYGGQVQVGGSGNYTVKLRGGSNWMFTGKYDPVLQTGHSDYPGHSNGNYANSSGDYGFDIKHAPVNGISVEGGASKFELSFMEISSTGFAGLVLKTDNTPTAIMDGVKVHDLYIHDTEAEGMYVGNTQGVETQHKFTDLEVYNNRVLRTGAEGIQLVNMGNGVNIHHNVVVMTAMDWKDPFGANQEGCLQYYQRDGSASIHDNIFIGGGEVMFNYKTYAATTDVLHANDEVYVYNNYFAHGRSYFGFIGEDASNRITKLRFENNVFRSIVFSWNEVHPAEVDRGILFYTSYNTANPLIFNDNIRDGGQDFIDVLGGNNGTTSHVSASGNATVANIAPVQFSDPNFPAQFDWSTVELWDDYSQWWDIPIYYQYGDYVYQNGNLYKCIQAGTHTGINPSTSPSTWQLQTPMTDDFRLHSSSPYQSMGLLD